MKLPRTRFFLAQALLLANMVYANDKDSSVNLQALDYSFPGVLITGEFRSGANASVLEYEGNESTGIGAASEVGVKIQARPTKESRVTAMFRIHQDWQKAHEEGLSPFLFDWLSYDGKAWDGKIDFNLGDMRVGYTPLTISAPLLNLANEPEILAIRRKDAMSYKHLEDTDQRLLQGLNFAINSGNLAFLDNLLLQGTFSRLRAQAKKVDQIFFDFDNADRWLFAGRGGVELFGFSIGANYAYSFTKESGLENFGSSVKVDAKEPFLVEDNRVFSGILGVDIAKLAGMDGWKIGLSGEYAISKYETSNFYRDIEKVTTYITDSAYVYREDGTWEKTHLIAAITRDSMVYRTEHLDTRDGSAILVAFDFATPSSITDLSLSVKYIKNDKDFVSELAQSPIYYTPSRVLNASAVDGLRIAASTMENLYFANYTNDPLTSYNLSGVRFTEDKLNNNRKAHFLRSGYNNSIYTPAELGAIAASQDFDPGVNLALPFGLATSNRAGVLMNIDWALLDGKIAVNAFATRVAQEEPDAVYLDVGGGASVEIGKFIGLEKTINMNLGFGKAAETDNFERSSTRASAGLRANIWSGLSLLGGFQMVSKEYGKLLPDVTGNELLWLAGPEIKIAEGSYFNLQYGMLNYEFKEVAKTYTLDRSLFSADIRIKF
ncbi:MAG: hypothetical protein LBH25_03890 [Fibromonadaceae bacterium]|jgi:hypothetical protein|nr:hypothetical protein [Fibromonadaceae bacterium]